MDLRVAPALGHRVAEGTRKGLRVDFFSGAGGVRWWLSTRTVKVDILDLPPPCRVTLVKLQNLSEPPFPFLCNGNNSGFRRGRWELESR